MNITHRLFLIVFIILAFISCKKTTTGSDPVVITFPDANFEELIRDTLDKPSGDILDTDLETVTNIYSHNDDISNITGIEYCINLQNLGIDLSNISDISMLDNLTNLQSLSFISNQISDITALSGLTNLVQIYLGNNQISDVSALSGLLNLEYLNFYYNQITDILPLVNNNGIDSGDEINLKNNPLSATSINTYIPQLEARGVTVFYDEPEMVVTFPDANFEALIRETLNIPTNDIMNTDLSTILTISGNNRGITNITGIEHCKNLERLDLDQNSISEINLLNGLTKLKRLSFYNNYLITDINPMASLTNLEQLYLNNNLIIDVTPLSGLSNLTVLGLSGNQIEDISILSSLINLQDLSLANNAIHNISILSNLTNLVRLDLGATQIIDTTPLSTLINLETLWISNNVLTSLSGIANLINLNFLHISNTQTTTINDLAGLVNLTRLYMFNNQIVEISPISELINLQYVALRDNQVADLQPFVNNTGINNGDEIWLENNPLSATSINTYIPQLEALGVTVHQ